MRIKVRIVTAALAMASLFVMGAAPALAAHPGAAPAAAADVKDVAPVLSGYDVGSLTLRGRGFLPNHAVWVRVTVTGALSCGDQTYTDYRTSQPLLQFTSDGAGNLTAHVDARTAVPPLSYCGYWFTGAVPGGTVYFVAHDGRTAPGATGLLWSNTISVRN
jgi:hypothetical protein